MLYLNSDKQNMHACPPWHLLRLQLELLPMRKGFFVIWSFIYNKQRLSNEWMFGETPIFDVTILTKSNWKNHVDQRIMNNLLSTKSGSMFKHNPMAHIFGNFPDIKGIPFLLPVGKGLCLVCLQLSTPRKSNMDTYNPHSWSEIPLPNHHF